MASAVRRSDDLGGLSAPRLPDVTPPLRVRRHLRTQALGTGRNTVSLVWTVTAEAPAETVAVIAEAVFAHGRSLATGGDARPIACLVHDGDVLIAGASGRTEYQRLFISYLWVGEAHRRRGIARRVLRELEAEAARRGCHDAVIETLDDSVATMYARLGYQRVAHLPRYVGPFDRHIMVKPALAS